MAKRAAENQLTKDDNPDGDDAVESDVRDTAFAPVEGRPIRGLPKRGMTGANPAAPPAPQPSFSATTAPTPSSNQPFSGFAFGSTCSASAPSQPFSFGSTGTASTQASQSTRGPEKAPAASPFSGFSFGQPASAPVAPQPTEAAEKPPAASPFSGFSFAKPAGGAAPSSAPFTFGASAGAPTATANGESTPSAQAAESKSATPKPFSGFTFGSSKPSSSQTPADPPIFGSSMSTQPPKPIEPSISTPSSNGPAPSLPTPPPEGEVSFYTNIRGLNTAILSFLSTTLEADPFLDLSNVFPSLADQYRKHVDTAVGSGWRPESSKSSQATQPAKDINGSAPPAGPSMPTVGTFSLPKASTTSGSTPGVGFTPTISTSSTSSPFSFPAFVPPTAKAVPTPAATPKKPSAEVSKLVEDVIANKSDDAPTEAVAPKPFTFGAPASTSQEPKSGGLFSFAPSGPIHPPAPGSESFTPSKNIESPFPASPAKLGKFGPGGSQPQLSFGGASASPSTPGPSKPVGFAFGSSPSGSGGFNIGSGSGAPANSTASSSFSFGAKPAAPAPSSSFSFGSAAASGDTKTAPSSSVPFGSGAKPSFGFGTTPTAASAAVKPTFSFANASTTSSGLATPEPGSGDVSETNSDAALGDDAGSSKNLAESVGAGEEGEETVSERRTKLHQLVNGQFEVKGLGVVKLKRSEREGKRKRRLLMRSDGAGAILLNMTINEKFDPSVEGPMIKFLGFDLNGKPTVYGLRVKNKEIANEFLEELKKEVDAIKGK